MNHHHNQYNNNDEKEHACSHFRTGECWHKLECRFQHKFCLNGDNCKIMDRCKYLHPNDEAFAITCKKSWEHCPHGKVCKYKQHADQDYNNNDNNHENKKRFDNLKKSDDDGEFNKKNRDDTKRSKKNKGCDSSDHINKEAVAKNNAEEKGNQQNKINKQSNYSKHSDEIALSEILKLLLKEEMDHLIVYIDQKFDILEREIGEKKKKYKLNIFQ